MADGAQRRGLYPPVAPYNTGYLPVSRANDWLLETYPIVGAELSQAAA